MEMERSICMIEKGVNKTRLEVENVKVNVSEMSRRTGFSNKTIKKILMVIKLKKLEKKRIEVGSLY